MYGGDGGIRTHVQRYCHFSIYERSRYIIIRQYISLATGFCTASLISLFSRPQTEGELRSPLRVRPQIIPRGRWNAGSAKSSCYAATARFSLFLPVIIGVAFLRAASRLAAKAQPIPVEAVTSPCEG